jgi:hypothetical protein
MVLYHNICSRFYVTTAVLLLSFSLQLSSVFIARQLSSGFIPRQLLPFFIRAVYWFVALYIFQYSCFLAFSQQLSSAFFWFLSHDQLWFGFISPLAVFWCYIKTAVFRLHLTTTLFWYYFPLAVFLALFHNSRLLAVHISQQLSPGFISQQLFYHNSCLLAFFYHNSCLLAFCHNSCLLAL